jgi:predicted transcriptional regulator
MTPRPVTPPLSALTRREREIMHAIFAAGNRASAEDIRRRLTAPPPSSSATRTMLARLETKGHLRHRVEQGRFVYSARTPPATARRAALRHYLQTFFRGSLGDMVLSLVRQESWTDEELNALRAAIEQARRDGKPR